ncbi:protein of unknown function [Cohaesibacter sp. ES.047]|uniref:DUF4865 family protein n=1 Tax=Cohaesibacter sp. ES.047 TaxID=1798205 RepID=UPI000BB78B26|nr:DUF4865 family protein [Cohaesibacter sp. ES.047]SNY89909.1 protein of unknown function [Cohaesibacter sp. ES.047]
MIAMQYSFTLPADYDMERIDRRIREKGAALDGFARLRFKAYLSARKHPEDGSTAQNLYAPFYLWDEAEGASAFLSHPGFAGVTQSFGWPSVQIWLPWGVRVAEDLHSATFATRTIAPIDPFSDMARIRDALEARVEIARDAGALATVTGFDPTNWKSVDFSLWAEDPEGLGDTCQIYDVGYVAT